MKWWHWAGLAGGAVAASAALRSRASADTGGGDEVRPSGANMGERERRLTNALGILPMLDSTQRSFLLLTAYGESKFSPTAHNDSTSEVAASAKAADGAPEIVARVKNCGVPAQRLRTGSWGMFQRLAPYLAGDAFEIFGNEGCEHADPTRANFAFQIASACETAKDLQNYNGWKAYPTVGNLRLGWAAPALMGYISDNQKRLDKYRNHCRSIGLQPSFVDAPIGQFPNDTRAIYRTLVQAGYT